MIPGKKQTTHLNVDKVAIAIMTFTMLFHEES